MTTDTRTVNEAWRDAMNRYDFDGVAACFATDGVHVDNGTGQRTRGPVEIRAAYAGFFAAISDLRIEETSHMSAESGYAAEWTMSGVHTGDLPGLPATGRSFSVVGSKFAEARDGKITSASLYWNMADLLTQIGVFPPPA